MENFDTIIDQRVEAFYNMIAHRISPEDMARIKDAYLFTCEAHKGQFRKDGKPFITHPLEVACIIGGELELGYKSIIAALLHDVVEDTPYEVEDIQARFGEDVAFLVKAVTKEKKANYEMSKQLDNFKQMLDSVQYDIRAILIKLADRLHNMRTLSSLHPKKQMKIAGEADYFYAPLANKLGLYYIKGELQNLSLQYRCPKEFEELNRLLQEEEEKNRSQMADFTNKIQALLEKNAIPVRIVVQYRTPYSLWFRMKKLGMDFKNVDSKCTIWIIYSNNDGVSEKDLTLRIYSILTDVIKEKPNSIFNYIDSPKENGYQSFHVKLLNEQSGWEDVHISSERMIRNSRLGCVAERTEQNIENWINKFRKVLEEISAHIQEGSFIENVVSNFYSDDIRVFTPKGASIILPQRATAIDFAYEIHSSIGNHAQYARINGKLCSMKTVLRRGDCVEIGVNKAMTPKPDWLNHIRTFKAKKQLEARFKRMEVSPYTRCMQCLPLPGDELIGFREGEKKITIHKRNCSEASLLATQVGDSIVDVNFEVDKKVLYPVGIQIKAIDRFHLLRDLTDFITEKQKLSISDLSTKTVDEIVDCTIHFGVHSAGELQEIITAIYKVEGVDEVRKLDLK